MLQSFVIVLREGFESFLIVAITLAYLRRTARAGLAPAVYWGVAASVGISALLGMVLLRGAYGHRVNVRRFFQVTGTFLLLFAVQVTVYALHELSEAGVFPLELAMPFHNATEAYSPHGVYGRWFSPVLVAACAFWLLAGWLADRRTRRTAAAA